MPDDEDTGSVHRRPIRRACILPMVIIVVALLVLGVAIWALVDRPGQGVIAVPGMTKGVPDDGSGSTGTAPAQEGQ
jgi:hypothetical protein